MNCAAAESNLSQLMEQEQAFHEDVKRTATPRVRSDEALIQHHHGEVHNDIWRKMIVQWCYNVIDHIQADREIVYVAINILDRFLETQANQAQVTVSSPSPVPVPDPGPAREYLTDRKDYEAAVMASLLITLKLQGISVLSIKDLTKMSRNSVRPNDILRAGEAIAQNLQWNKQLPTAAKFAHALINLLPYSVHERTKQALFDDCIFSIELSIQDKRCCSELPSLVAWMVLENAMESIGSEGQGGRSRGCLSKDIINSFRANVVRITGLQYNQSIFDTIHSLRDDSIGNDHLDNIPSTQGPTIIPQDDEDGRPSSKAISYNLPQPLYSRPLHDTKVVSMDDMKEFSNATKIKSAIKKKRNIKEQLSLSRSKRVRAF